MSLGRCDTIRGLNPPRSFCSTAAPSLPVSQVRQAAFTADGALAILDSGGRVQLWDLANRTPKAALPLSAKASSIAISRDGSVIGTASDDRQLRIWDSKTMEMQA